MASGPITAWQIEEGKVEVVTNFLLLGSKITADGDCSHEIRRWLLPGRKAMTNLDSVLKSRDITLFTKVHIVKDMWSSQQSHTVVRAGLKRRQNAKEPMPSNFGAREDSWESLGKQGDQTSQI